MMEAASQSSVAPTAISHKDHDLKEEASATSQKRKSV